MPNPMQEGQPARDALFADNPWTPPTEIAIFRDFPGIRQFPGPRAFLLARTYGVAHTTIARL
jgi:hypothetical protein